MLLLKLAVLLSFTSVVNGFFEWKNCVTVSGKVPAPKIIPAHGCEDKSDVVLSCLSGYKIAVLKAFFGHGHGYKATCDSSWFARNCGAKEVLNKVKYLCQNQQTCRIKPVESVLGKTSCMFGLNADLFIGYVCNKESIQDVLSIKSMTLSPTPLTLPGQINTSISLLVKRALPSTTKLRLDIEKKVLGAAWVSIPCVSNFGSCTYDNFCDLLRGKVFSKCDRAMENTGISCDCPIPTGLFTIPTQLIKVTKEMIEQIPVWNWIVNGKYRITTEFLDVYNNVIGCIRIQIEININSKKKKRNVLANERAKKFIPYNKLR